jgi:hypothetical protein
VVIAQEIYSVKMVKTIRNPKLLQHLLSVVTGTLEQTIDFEEHE